MTSHEVAMAVATEYKKYQTEMEKCPFEYPPMALTVFDGNVHLFMCLWEYLTKIEYLEGGIRLTFIFPNGNVAYATNTRNTDYLWKIMSQAINNKDSLFSGYDDIRAIGTVLAIKADNGMGVT